MLKRLFDRQVLIFLLDFIVILIPLDLRMRKHKVNLIERGSHCHSIYIGDFDALVQNCL